MTHVNCNICAKKVFFNRSEFLKAHGEETSFIPASPWVNITTAKKENKNSPIFVTKLACRFCKSDNSPNRELPTTYRSGGF